MSYKRTLHSKYLRRVSNLSEKNKIHFGIEKDFNLSETRKTQGILQQDENIKKPRTQEEKIFRNYSIYPRSFL